jgi:hypothetical protein
MRAASFLACVATAIVLAVTLTGCTTKEPTPSTYFDRNIAPILENSCVRTNTGAGCHVADPKGNAFGNLDMTTFAGVDKRRDLLLDYGPYLQPSLLVKNVGPLQLTYATWDGTQEEITTDIKHTGGAILDPTASAYQTLRRWIESGATVNNTGIPPVLIPQTPCSEVVPSAAGFDPTTDPTGADFAMFTAKGGANSVLGTTCGAGNCHGTSVNALYLTCGSSPEEVRWNYFAAVGYLAATPSNSEIVRRPLASAQGGSYHEGGPLFSSIDDPNYTTLLNWANAHGPPQVPNLDPAFLFFAQKVQPILVKKGCMMEQCHSAGMFHDYRLRGGTAGTFSLNTTQRNYAFSVAQMSFESDDVNASRLVAKNLYRPDLVPGSPGLTHRGGPLFEDFASGEYDAGAPDGGVPLANGASCDAGNYDYDNDPVDAIPPYCIVREWHRRERVERNLTALSGIVYVQRPPPSGPDRPQDFDVFAGGASLHIIAATLAAGGAVTTAADTTVDLTTCGLMAGADVRRPQVSWDGKTIAFAARSSDASPLAIYTMNADGTGCALQPDIAMHDAMGNGLLEHDFDPVFSPPGPDGIERIVFASTRGNLDGTAFDYAGPQRTPEDPTKPNSNLYVLEPKADGSGQMQIRQLTWQLDMERMPSFMQDGRLIFTVEKREPGFYQLALRRQNLDGGDYHPLFAQRATVGATQATYAVEIADKTFATIFSMPTAVHGAGSLALVNRSIGLDFMSTNPKDYLIDPSVIDASSPSAPESDFFLHSSQIVAMDGSYTSPAGLPDGNILVSYGAGDPSSFGGDYDVYVLNPTTGAKTMLFGGAGTAEVEAAPIYARVPKGIFASALDEPNGHTSVGSASTAADVTVLSMPILASLLFQNTPTGRLLEGDLGSFDLYEELPPDVSSFPAACGGYTVCDDYGMVYVRRRLMGAVPILKDGSAHFRIPGGLPFLLHLADDTESKAMGLPRWQRETMTFVPGETAHQAMTVPFFDNLCAGCHGAVSGKPVDFAVGPDFITQASNVSGVTANATDYSGPPSSRGPIASPPFTP